MQITALLPPCGQCDHPEARHEVYFVEGDPEPWSWCLDCGSHCQYEPRHVANPEEPQHPEPECPAFAPAPFGSGWSVVNADADRLLDSGTPLSPLEARNAALLLCAAPECAADFGWREVP